MFGCGKFGETEMLLYIDNKLKGKIKSDIDLHLMQCDECLKEVIEINKINALTEQKVDFVEKIPVFVKLRFVEGKITECFSSSDNLLITEGVNVRSEYENSHVVSLEFKDGTLKIIPSSSENFMLVFEFENEKQIKIISENKILFSVNTKKSKFNLQKGIYECMVDKETVKIDLE